VPLSELHQEIERVLLLDTNSKDLPSLPNKKGKTNWVEKSGGLPSYINRIAKHLHSEKGMDVSKAIASAVNTVKKWCAGGDNVKADTKAKACAAVAEWEAKKAQSKTNLAVGRLPGEDKERLVTRHGVFLSASDAAHLDSLEVMEIAEGDFDPGRYALALGQARLDLGVTTFDPQAHPRDYKGQFKKAIGALKPGDTVKLPDGVSVERASVSGEPLYKVHRSKRKDSGHDLAGTADNAASMALKRSTSAGPAGQLPDDLAPKKTGVAVPTGPQRPTSAKHPSAVGKGGSVHKQRGISTFRRPK
jgi:hypothetical protein